MDPIHQELIGTVDRIIYENEQTGFVIFVLVDKTQSAVVKASAPLLKVGQEVRVQGAWIVNPKFGKQFQAEQCVLSIPTTVIGIKKYLASGAIKGIGPVFAERIVQTFGERTLEVLENNPTALKRVTGVGAKRIQAVIDSWQEHRDVAQIMAFLQGHGVSPAFAAKIYKKYGAQAVTIIQDNPYRLAQEVWGIGFKMADQIARSVGFDLESLPRVKAGVVHAIQETIGLGNLYARAQDIKENTIKLLELSANAHELLAPAVQELCDNATLTLVNHDESPLLTLTNVYRAECGVVQRLNNLAKYPSGLRLNTQKIYEKLRTQETKIELNEDQQRAIITTLTQKITIVTGGPGTGKTTLVKQLLDVLDEQRVRYKLAAPTGRAAKRMTESTRRNAYTIHRLLEFDPSAMKFKHNEQNTLTLDMIIVDEASMIDIFLAHALLKAFAPSTHVLFIGDIDQLPPVGAGNFLRDIIKSERFACIKLTQIFRQAHNSLITINAHRVNGGMFPTTQIPETANDFMWLNEEDPTKVLTHLTAIFQRRLASRGFRSEDAVVLTPMNRGSSGTHQLNRFLQDLLNKNAQKQITHGFNTFKEGDRVMQIRNNYEKFVFNGDVGIVKTIDLTEQEVVVDYAERLVTYKTAELDELVLAYATTVHKSQGSEYPVVIIPLFTQHFTLLARNLLYTAITRAKKWCILIGQPKAIAIAVKNNKSGERLTLLSEFLTKEELL